MEKRHWHGEMRNFGRKGKNERSFDELILDMLNLTIRKMGSYLWVIFLQVTGNKKIEGLRIDLLANIERFLYRTVLEQYNYLTCMIL